jgi:hypothetical protein
MGTSSGVTTQMLPGREFRWQLPTARLKSPDGLHLFLQRQLPHKANLPCPNCARLSSLAPRSRRRFPFSVSCRVRCKLRPPRLSCSSLEQTFSADCFRTETVFPVRTYCATSFLSALETASKHFELQKCEESHRTQYLFEFTPAAVVPSPQDNLPRRHDAARAVSCGSSW